MTYEQTIDYLYNAHPAFSVQGPGAYKPGLQTSRAIDDAFGNPHRSFCSIHVGGTNGKGSTSHTLAAILQKSGYKVGLYTSPHLVDFRERIRVDGEMMPREAVVDFVERYRAMELPLEPSFFELTTIMAFDWFAKQGVDFAVIEVGLGGRLDTTNIITPLLSVITNVSLDHVALLGATEEAIAGEKAGIIKAGVPVVIGHAEGAVRKVFQDTAATVGAPIVFAEDRPFPFRDADGTFLYALARDGEPTVPSDLRGVHQPQNANLVLTAVELLRSRIAIPDTAVEQALPHVCELTGLMGRWMPVDLSAVGRSELGTKQTALTASDKAPRAICDTGHNIGAWQDMGQRLQALADSCPCLRMVIGFVNDKDVTHIFETLPLRRAVYYFVTPSVARGLDSAELLPILRRIAPEVPARAYPTVADGIAAALADSAPDDVVFIGGSTFVVADLLMLISQQ